MWMEIMTKAELWEYAVNFAARKGDFHEGMILRLLKMADGDVSKALGLMTKTHWYEGGEGELYPNDSIAQRLGGRGGCGPDIPRIRINGSASAYSIEAWYPESDFVRKKADLVITWREVFEFILAGRERSFQLDLF
jgi:hypothetical protein